MTIDSRRDMDKVYVNYERVHQDTGALYDQLKEVSSKGAILVAVARGGWLTTRVLAASYEEDGLESLSFSVSATYEKHRTPEEYVTFTQSLDSSAISVISEMLDRGLPIVVVDSVSQTGRELLAVKKYLIGLFPNAQIIVGVMTWVHYNKSNKIPWRSVELEPDYYGSLIKNEQMPYIEFPWEYSSIQDFNMDTGE